MSDELKPQSVDSPMLRQLLVDYRHASSLSEQHMRINEIIAHIDAWRVPAGYKLVPIEPTEDMRMAGCRFLWKCGNNEATDRDAELCWSAMIEAAPKPEDA
jgi:hypothetical protein